MVCSRFLFIIPTLSRVVLLTYEEFLMHEYDERSFTSGQHVDCLPQQSCRHGQRKFGDGCRRQPLHHRGSRPFQQREQKKEERHHHNHPVSVWHTAATPSTLSHSAREVLANHGPSYTNRQITKGTTSTSQKGQSSQDTKPGPTKPRERISKRKRSYKSEYQKFFLLVFLKK